MPRRILPIAIVLLSATACERPRHSDIKQIAERHSNRYHSQCNSWIHSFKTGFAYCASPPVDVPFVEYTPAKKAPKKAVNGPVTKEALVKAGETVYGSICAACHQATGLGVPGAFPPLAGSGEFYGSPENMAGIIVNGLSGEITVQGKAFNGAMPAQGQLSNYEIAAVATFVRNSWGNDDGIVTPDQVKTARK